MAFIPNQSAVAATGAPVNPATGSIFDGTVSTINLAIGLTYNFYHENLIFNAKNITIDAVYSGDGGVLKQRSFQITPGVIGVYSLVYNAYNVSSQLLESKTISINVVSKTLGSSTKNVLFLGDSQLASGTVTDTLKTKNTADGGTVYNLIGSIPSTNSRFEAMPGWATTDYLSGTTQYQKFVVSGVVLQPLYGDTYTNNGITWSVRRAYLVSGSGWIETVGAGSPLSSGTLTKTGGTGDSSMTFASTTTVPQNPLWDTVNSQVDFVKYVAKYGLATPHCLVIQLGVNDIYGIKTPKTQSQINAIVTNLQTIITAFLNVTTGYTTAKVIISLPPICGLSRQVAGNDCNFNWIHIQAYEQSMRLLFKTVVTVFDSGAWNAAVSISPIFLFVDRRYSYPISSELPNQYESSVTLIEFLENVHPEISGRNQQKDIYYSQLRYLFNS